MRRLLTVTKCCGNGCKNCTQIDINKTISKPEIKEEKPQVKSKL